MRIYETEAACLQIIFGVMLVFFGLVLAGPANGPGEGTRHDGTSLLIGLPGAIFILIGVARLGYRVLRIWTPLGDRRRS